jgi:putative transposase
MNYPSNITDKEWELIKKHFETGNYGKSRKWDKRILFNAILYIIKTGCQWKLLPNDFPPYKTVYSFYKRAKEKGIFEKVMKDLVEKSRVKMGLNASPSYSLIDSQSIKTTGNAVDR